jgi:PKD repeat protein/subtilisin-like proprotein convertase family protein
MQKIIIPLLTATFLIQTAKSQSICLDTVSFNQLFLPIPDEDTVGLNDTHSVTITGATSLGVDVRLLKVCFQISHTWVGDLVVSLTAPNGNTVVLMDQPGVPASNFGCGEDDVDVCIVLGTGNELENECNAIPPAISGDFTAYNGTNLNLINTAGGSPNGNWTLKVRDLTGSDIGTLNSWSMLFEVGPIASWNPNPDTICASSPPLNLNTFVTGTTGGTWSGNGVTGNNFNPSGLSGNVSITYTVSASGCTSSETHDIYVTPAVPSCSFNTSLINLSATFINTSTGGVTYFWDFGDGQTSTNFSPVINYATPGTYTVTLTVTNVCGSSTCTQNITIQSCPDLIIDGSFESGIPSIGWAGYSQNFSTPFCNQALCGLGGGSGPQSGSWWAWFGGTNVFEEAFCSQPVTIPPNTVANLYFYLEVPVTCDSPADFLKLAIGTDTIFAVDGSSSLCGIVGYTLQSIPLSQYADGITRTLNFFSRTYAINNNVTNFFVDNVVLLTCPVGITEQELAQSIEVFPNPTSISLAIKLTGMQSDVEIGLLDVHSRTLHEARIHKKEIADYFIDVSKLAKGVYFLNLKNDKTGITQKIIIQ